MFLPGIGGLRIQIFPGANLPSEPARMTMLIETKHESHAILAITSLYSGWGWILGKTTEWQKKRDQLLWEDIHTGKI